MKLLWVATALLLMGCGADGPTSPAGPPDVRVVEASMASLGTQNGTPVYSLTATVENRGGNGFWRAEIWANAATPGGANTLLGTSNEYEAVAGSMQTVTWEVAPAAPAAIVVQVRDTEAAEWRESHRHDLR